MLIGASQQTVTGKGNAGAVFLLTGGRDGLDWNRALSYHQGQFPAHDPRRRMERAETWDFFGSGVTVLNLDGAGPMDMLVGAPFEDVGTTDDNSGLLTRLRLATEPAGTPTSFTSVRPNRDIQLDPIYADKLWYWTDFSAAGLMPRITSLGRVLLS